jgi:DNA (cytosine-5)-methyltransferase 3A
MKVLSLFDGISVAQQALKKLGVKDLTYYASEIDKYAISLTQKNHPDTIQLGDVKGIGTIEALKQRFYEKKNIDLLIGGSPCQDLSIAKKGREGLSGSRSSLFYEYVRILKEVKPKYFILENVNSMPKEAKETISKELFGIEPIMINAALVSAQNRKRLFWVGKLVGDTYEQVKIELPEDKNIFLKDILEEGVIEREKSYCIDANYFKGGKIGGTHQSSTRNYTIRIGQLNKGSQGERVYSPEGKSVTLSANGGGRGARTGLYEINGAASRTYSRYEVEGEERSKRIEVRDDGKSSAMTLVQSDSMVQEKTVIRKLTPIECERLQSLPDNYTEGVSNTQRYKALGNAFNCEVIKHILKNII